MRKLLHIQQQQVLSTKPIKLLARETHRHTVSRIYFGYCTDSGHNPFFFFFGGGELPICVLCFE